MFPQIATRGVGEAAYWMADAPDRLTHLAVFAPLYTAWLKNLLAPSYALTFINNAQL